MYLKYICSITGPSNNITGTIDEASNNAASELSSGREPFPPGVHQVVLNQSVPRGLARKNKITLLLKYFHKILHS